MGPPRPRAWPSAVLVLGTLSGVLAGVLYMAISVPLVVVAMDLEEANAVGRVRASGETIERWLASGMVIGAPQVAELGLGWVDVLVLSSGQSLYAVNAPEGLVDRACAAPDPGLIDHGGGTWATSCFRTPTHRIALGAQPHYELGNQILFWTFTLSLVVGIVTAFAQARLLSPLTEMSLALQRVGRGERNVRLRSTGLNELDEVVDRINEAARHVEDRVDAITARITVVQEMARMVAHEIRNPLQSLELLTSLIASEEQAHERQDLARAIHDEIRTLDQVVQRLLREGASTGALRLHRKPQSVAALVEQVTRLHQAEAQRRGVRLSVGLLSRDEAPVDGAMLGRSIDNLVQNALRAVPDKTGEVRLSMFRDRDHLHVAVDDNGPGVDEALGATIFESGTTGREGGHGIGLALVRAVLLAHEGSIEYTRSPLGGARFVATLPLESVEKDE